MGWGWGRGGDESRVGSLARAPHPRQTLRHPPSPSQPPDTYPRVGRSGGSLSHKGQHVHESLRDEEEANGKCERVHEVGPDKGSERPDATGASGRTAAVLAHRLERVVRGVKSARFRIARFGLAEVAHLAKDASEASVRFGKARLFGHRRASVCERCGEIAQRQVGRCAVVQEDCVLRSEVDSPCVRRHCFLVLARSVVLIAFLLCREGVC